MSRASLAFKLLIKGGIAAIFLGLFLFGSLRLVWSGLAGIFHFPDWGRGTGGTHGGSDDWIFDIVTMGMIAAIGLAAVRGARATWKELREPEVEPPNYPPGSRWAPASELVDASAPEHHASAPELHVAAPELDLESAGRTVKARPTIARALIWIGHGLMILSVLGILLSFIAGHEAAPMGIGMGIAIFFYVAGFAIGLLDE